MRGGHSEKNRRVITMLSLFAMNDRSWNFLMLSITEDYGATLATCQGSSCVYSLVILSACFFISLLQPANASFLFFY